jgi:hypothetical protein
MTPIAMRRAALWLGAALLAAYLPAAAQPVAAGAHADSANPAADALFKEQFQVRNLARARVVVR